MDVHDWPCRIKSVRRKRRLVKTDRDKQLIQLAKRHRTLLEQKAKLPWVALEEPYQRGWKRFFVLRDDVKCSPQAEFYETLLTKINTVEYHHDKSFKRKKRRKGKYGYVIRKQALKEFDPHHWEHPKSGLTEQDRAFFTRVEVFDVKTRHLRVKYVITEPCRFVLKVEPNMITHHKLIDTVIESELDRINNRISRQNLGPRIDMLTRGRGYHWHGWYDYELLKYKNNIKNIPRYSPKETYLDLDT